MGYIGDKEWSPLMLIYNLSMVVCGVSVVVMPFATSYWALAVLAAVFGEDTDCLLYTSDAADE